MPSSFSNVLPFAADPVLWDDLRIPVSALAPGATPADPIVYGPSGAVRIRGFNGNVTPESMDFTVQLPHCWKIGTNISPHIHWCPTTNNAGNVIWYLDYYWLNINGTIPVLATIDTGAVAAGGTAWKHLVAEFPDIVGAGFGISSMLICRIHRNPVGSDTYPDDAGLLEVDFHHQIDSMGSRQEFIK